MILFHLNNASKCFVYGHFPLKNLSICSSKPYSIFVFISDVNYHASELAREREDREEGEGERGRTRKRKERNRERKIKRVEKIVKCISPQQ